MGIPFWMGQGFGLGLSVITDPEKAGLDWARAPRARSRWPGAFGTWWQADPEEDMVIIYLIQNSMPLGRRSRRRAGDRPAHGRPGRPADVPKADLRGPGEIGLSRFACWRTGRPAWPDRRLGLQVRLQAPVAHLVGAAQQHPVAAGEHVGVLEAGGVGHFRLRQQDGELAAQGCQFRVAKQRARPQARASLNTSRSGSARTSSTLRISRTTTLPPARRTSVSIASR